MDDVKRKFFAGMGKVRETRCFPKLILIHMMTLPETQQEFQSVKIHVLPPWKGNFSVEGY